MLIGLPTFATSTTKSVCLAKKAGICSTSTTSATGLVCATSCTSVIILTPNSALSLLKIAKPSSRPTPLKELIEVRLALSKDALKTKGIPSF